MKFIRERNSFLFDLRYRFKSLQIGFSFFERNPVFSHHLQELLLEFLVCYSIQLLSLHLTLPLDAISADCHFFVFSSLISTVRHICHTCWWLVSAYFILSKHRNLAVDSLSLFLKLQHVWKPQVDTNPFYFGTDQIFFPLTSGYAYSYWTR